MKKRGEFSDVVKRLAYFDEKALHEFLKITRVGNWLIAPVG